eukprot:7833099-Alexandrium_andersonii.AAC.1
MATLCCDLGVGFAIGDPEPCRKGPRGLRASVWPFSTSASAGRPRSSPCASSASEPTSRGSAR